MHFADYFDSIKIYLEDYRDTMKQKDQFKIDFKHESCQLNYRSFIITHMKSFASKNSIFSSTLQLAVYILDILMDEYIIAEDKFLLVANVCISIAAKLNEYSSNIPKLTELNSSVANIYEISEYKKLEISILKFFKGFINFPTPAYCSHYYFEAILDHEDVRIIRERNETIREAQTQLKSLLATALERYIDDVHYMQYYPASLLGAAAISASRAQHGLANWTSQLEFFTGYSEEDLKEIRNFLLQPQLLICTHCNN